MEGDFLLSDFEDLTLEPKVTGTDPMAREVLARVRPVFTMTLILNISPGVAGPIQIPRMCTTPGYMNQYSAITGAGFAGEEETPAESME